MRPATTLDEYRAGVTPWEWSASECPRCRSAKYKGAPHPIRSTNNYCHECGYSWNPEDVELEAEINANPELKAEIEAERRENRMRSDQPATAEPLMPIADVLAILKADNPKATAEQMRIYADAFLSYAEAASNITRLGNIVSHPRTGAPIQNPYIKIRDSAITNMGKVNLKTDKLWSHLP